MKEPTVKIDAAGCGPPGARKGEKMWADWPGYTEVFEFDGKRWVLIATVRQPH